ncbi:hypothetical protein PN36_24325 [Candidatus Thiomargarita nelsonii]|uniref:Uncharacterized protein n=1 Tax=Candidatus Thiomargarita nelsonii TaxID=1003181 RepID=A0A0A6PCU3_9GAMM|nr:hypothetical protein PN36_24325 [Candidatus Thiomargarita nelsonii]
MKNHLKNIEKDDKVEPLMTLKKTLASYDETINIMNSLSLDDANRKTLAWAYINRGDVLQALGKMETDALGKALLSYEKAIRLAKNLGFEAVENRKILANAYMRRGDVLRVTGTQRFENWQHCYENA